MCCIRACVLSVFKSVHQVTEVRKAGSHIRIPLPLALEWSTIWMWWTTISTGLSLHIHQLLILLSCHFILTYILLSLVMFVVGSSIINIFICCFSFVIFVHAISNASVADAMRVFTSEDIDWRCLCTNLVFASLQIRWASKMMSDWTCIEYLQHNLKGKKCLQLEQTYFASFTALCVCLSFSLGAHGQTTLGHRSRNTGSDLHAHT